MKKGLIIAIFVSIAIAQTQAQVTIKPGVKAGLNFSRFTNYDASFDTNFYLGAQLAIRFNKVYTLQPELVYSQQSGDVKYILDGSFYDYNIYKQNVSIDYLSLSAMSKFYLGKEGFHFVAGPSLDFKVNDNFKQNYYLDNPIGFDFAIIGGVGYSLSNGLSFDARFKQGIIDIYGNNYNTNIDKNNNGNYDEVVLNQSFQIGISYLFDLKK